MLRAMVGCPCCLASTFAVLPEICMWLSHAVTKASATEGQMDGLCGGPQQSMVLISKPISTLCDSQPKVCKVFQDVQ